MAYRFGQDDSSGLDVSSLLNTVVSTAGNVVSAELKAGSTTPVSTSSVKTAVALTLTPPCESR